MLTKERGGMTEYIPSPREKREALVRDHFLELTALMHQRLARLEGGAVSPEAVRCTELIKQIREEEEGAVTIHRALHQSDAVSVAE